MIINKSDLPNYVGNVPDVFQFNPRFIRWQCDVINCIDEFDYSNGPLEILLTGAAGSSKSLLACHLIAKHLALENTSIAIGRRSKPDLRDTIWDLLLKHIRCFEEGTDYFLNDTRMEISTPYGSKIITRSWGDRQSKKGRSLDLTMLVIEEATENDEKDKEAINELVARVGRQKRTDQMLVMFLTNPDSPSHWLYKRFFVEKSENRRVFHSVTTDNPFLPDSYIKTLESTYDPKMILRMRDGVWLDITGETIYHQYDSGLHEPTKEYEIDQTIPIHMDWDFNIGQGKPMSVCFHQVKEDKFHFFDEIIIEGSRTENILEEAANRGLLEHKCQYKIHGDATGTARDTRSNLSDYDIIDKFFQKYKQINGASIQYEREVLKSNPPIRDRHNVVNSYLKNSLGEVRLFVYPKCKTLREGFKLTKLKKGAQYQEDDAKYYQHVTTAAGYGIYYHHLIKNRKKSGAREA